MSVWRIARLAGRSLPVLRACVTTQLLLSLSKGSLGILMH